MVINTQETNYSSGGVVFNTHEGHYYSIAGMVINT